MAIQSSGSPIHLQSLPNPFLDTRRSNTPEPELVLPIRRRLFNILPSGSEITQASLQGPVDDLRLPYENPDRASTPPMSRSSESFYASQLQEQVTPKANRTASLQDCFSTPTPQLVINDDFASTFEPLKSKITEEWRAADHFPHLLAILKLVQQKGFIIGGSFALLLHEMNQLNSRDGLNGGTDFSRAPHDLDLWQPNNELILENTFLQNHNMILKGCITDARLSLSCGPVRADIIKNKPRKANSDLTIHNIEEHTTEIMGLKVLSLKILLLKLNIRICDLEGIEANTSLDQWKNDIQWIKQLDSSL